MRSTVSERKGEILIRSAESRLGIIESLGSARSGVGRACSRLAAPRTYAKVGLVTGGGVIGMLLLRALCRGSRKAVPAVRAGSVGSPFSSLLVQALTILVFPWLKARMQGGNWGDVLKGIRPSHYFFRWLGLEK